MNRTLLERVRCMLLTAGMSSKFWGEACKTAAYIINRSPSTAIEFKCPREMWTGKKPEKMSHLRVFGCAWAHVKQDKLKPRALNCLFLGYPEGVKGYRLWCIEPGLEKCIISRDVVFNELEMPLIKTLQATTSTDGGGAELEVEFNQSDEHILEEETDFEQQGNQGEDSDESDGYQLVRDKKKELADLHRGMAM